MSVVLCFWASRESCLFSLVWLDVGLYSVERHIEWYIRHVVYERRGFIVEAFSHFSFLCYYHFYDVLSVWTILLEPSISSDCLLLWSGISLLSDVHAISIFQRPFYLFPVYSLFFSVPNALRMSSPSGGGILSSHWRRHVYQFSLDLFFICLLSFCLWY